MSSNVGGRKRGRVGSGQVIDEIVSNDKSEGVKGGVDAVGKRVSKRKSQGASNEVDDTQPMECGLRVDSSGVPSVPRIPLIPIDAHLLCAYGGFDQEMLIVLQNFFELNFQYGEPTLIKSLYLLSYRMRAAVDSHQIMARDFKAVNILFETLHAAKISVDNENMKLKVPTCTVPLLLKLSNLNHHFFYCRISQIRT